MRKQLLFGWRLFLNLYKSVLGLCLVNSVLQDTHTHTLFGVGAFGRNSVNWDWV